MPAVGRGLDALISDLLLSEISSSSSCLWPKAWRVRKKTHASSPSTSGKTHEKTCPIETRLETRESTIATFALVPPGHHFFHLVVGLLL